MNKRSISFWQSSISYKILFSYATDILGMSVALPADIHVGKTFRKETNLRITYGCLRNTQCLLKISGTFLGYPIYQNPIVIPRTSVGYPEYPDDVRNAIQILLMSTKYSTDVLWFSF